VPNKQNIRRHGWKKQYIVVSSKKIIFYNSENEKMNADPVLILDLKYQLQIKTSSKILILKFYPTEKYTTSGQLPKGT